MIIWIKMTFLIRMPQHSRYPPSTPHDPIYRRKPSPSFIAQWIRVPFDPTCLDLTQEEDGPCDNIITCRWIRSVTYAEATRRPYGDLSGSRFPFLCARSSLIVLSDTAPEMARALCIINPLTVFLEWLAGSQNSENPVLLGSPPCTFQYLCIKPYARIGLDSLETPLPYCRMLPWKPWPKAVLPPFLWWIGMIVSSSHDLSTSAYCSFLESIVEDPPSIRYPATAKET